MAARKFAGLDSRAHEAEKEGMKAPDNPADPFKKALAEATRTLADDSDLTVTFTADPSGVAGDTMRLPQVSRRMTRDEVLLARGTADALAMRLRHHDPATHLRYTPSGPMARDLYESLETARCEALGARDMPGALSNIDAKLGTDAERKGYGRVTSTAEAPLAVAAGYLVREMASGRKLPPAAAHMAELWRPVIEAEAGGTLEGLQDTLADQGAFARLARQVIADLGYGDQLGEDPDQPDEDQPEDEAEPDDEAGDSQAGDQDDTEDSDSSPERSQEQQQDDRQASVSMEDDDAPDEMGDEADMPDDQQPPALRRPCHAGHGRAGHQGGPKAQNLPATERELAHAHFPLTSCRGADYPRPAGAQARLGAVGQGLALKTGNFRQYRYN